MLPASYLVYDYGECDYGECEYGGCDHGECDYGECEYGGCDYGECEYGGCDYGECENGGCEYGTYNLQLFSHYHKDNQLLYHHLDLLGPFKPQEFQVSLFPSHILVYF